MNNWKYFFQQFRFSAAILSVLAVVSCARMGQPDGGWYDETPPYVVSSTPEDKAINVKDKKIRIHFNEFIKVDNPNERVIISPPQIEPAEIKPQGKSIIVELKDSLKPNTTYTVDFSDAISDNNEGNPMGNYTYSFSTGAQIDTLEVSGTVLEASNLEPIKGILVGIYPDGNADSLFTTQPMLRVSRTDSHGHFVVKGIAPGSYKIYALNDMDGNYFFNQKSEKIAFSEDVLSPSSQPDIRQDTIWTDTLHISTINRIPYTHFYPDNIVLRAFEELQNNRYFIKSERPKANYFNLYFSYGSKEPVDIKGLNFDEKDAFITDFSPKGDTLTYWLRDTTLINQDTLDIRLTYQKTDSVGKLFTQVDTLQLISKEPYARRLRQEQKKIEDWKKEQDKAKRKGEPYDSIMPENNLEVKIGVSSSLSPDRNINIDFPTPLSRIDTAKIHLYARHDTLWYRAPFELIPRKDTTLSYLNDAYGVNQRQYVLRGEWRPEIEYSLEIDSTAFTDIYGTVSKKIKQGFKVRSNDEYSTILFTIQGLDGEHLVLQLLDSSDKVVKEVSTDNGYAEFFYVDPQTYYMRLFVDKNHNGKWDTGDFKKRIQPEEVYYFPREIECKAKWDFSETWNPKAINLAEQKPGKITKQKADKEQRRISRNLERAKKLGIKYLPGVIYNVKQEKDK